MKSAMLALSLTLALPLHAAPAPLVIQEGRHSLDWGGKYTATLSFLPDGRVSVERGGANYDGYWSVHGRELEVMEYWGRDWVKWRVALDSKGRGVARVWNAWEDLPAVQVELRRKD